MTTMPTVAAQAPPMRLLTPEETAQFLNIAPQTLSVWRSTRRYSLPYVKVGRAIRYRQADVEQFLADRTFGAAEQPAAPSSKKQKRRIRFSPAKRR